MKVVLFCGGMGTRIREYSENVPKPMIPIGGKPHLTSDVRQWLGDARGHLLGGDAEGLREGGRERHRRIAAGEVVDAAIALGLAENRDDFMRGNQSVVDQQQNRRGVARIAHWHTVNDAFHLPGTFYKDAGRGLCRSHGPSPGPTIHQCIRG